MKLWNAISILTMGALLVGGFYYFYVRDSALGWQITPRTVVTEAAIANLNLRLPPQGQKLFVSEEYLFSLFYPQNLEVKEYEEREGARTFVFEDPITRQGFQVFVVPLDMETIEAAVQRRFSLDVPSGIKQNEKNTSIDHTPGRIFSSRHDLLGETTEIWFLEFGYLYEITTYRDFGEQVISILETWEFPKV